MPALRRIADVDIASLPSPGGRDIGLGDGAFLDPSGRQTLAADNDDARTWAVIGPSELTASAQGQRLGFAFASPRSRIAWPRAVALSVILHAAVAGAFLKPNHEDVLIEGSVASQMAASGNASADQIAAGDVVDVEILPVPMVTVEAVPAESIEAIEPISPVPEVAEATPAEPVERAEAVPSTETATAEAARPTAEAPPLQASEPEQVQENEPETAQAASPEPEVRAAEPTEVEPPVETAAPAAPPGESTPAETAEAETAQPVEEDEAASRPEVEDEAVAEVADVPLPTPRPAYTPPPAPKVAEAQEKPKQAPRQQTAGSGGKSEADARQGVERGSDNAKAAASDASGKGMAAGNAAVSNYPGKVASKLRRSVRYPREARRQRLRGEVRVSFTVGRGGDVASARIAGSSGSPILDQAALEAVRRAAPFPPIPDAAGRSSWPFTVPLSFTR